MRTAALASVNGQQSFTDGCLRSTGSVHGNCGVSSHFYRVLHACAVAKSYAHFRDRCGAFLPAHPFGLDTPCG